jgi:hypothetical protein
LNVDFDPPLDYVEPVVKPLRPSKSTQEREVKETYDKKISEVAQKLTRIDGKVISEA